MPEEEKELRFRSAQLIERAENLIDKNRGILYKSSIGILKRGLIDAREKEDFSDLIEFLPRFESEYERLKLEFEKESVRKAKLRSYRIGLYVKSYSLKQLERKLSNLEKESLELMKKWSNRRPDERTQRKCRISNRADAVAREKLLIQDAIETIIEKKRN